MIVNVQIFDSPDLLVGFIIGSTNDVIRRPRTKTSEHKSLSFSKCELSGVVLLPYRVSAALRIMHRWPPEKRRLFLRGSSFASGPASVRKDLIALRG